MEYKYSLTKEDRKQFINELKENKYVFSKFISRNFLMHLFIFILNIIVCLLISRFYWLTFSQFIIFIIVEILVLCIYYLILYKNYTVLGLSFLAINKNIKLNIDDEYIVKVINEKFHVAIHYLDVSNIWETKNFYCLENSDFVLASNLLILKKEAIEIASDKNSFYNFINNHAQNKDKLLIAKNNFIHKIVWFLCISLFLLSNIVIGLDLRHEHNNKDFVVREINTFVIDEDSNASKLGIETFDLPLSVNGRIITYLLPQKVEAFLKQKNATLRYQKRKSLEEKEIKINTD